LFTGGFEIVFILFIAFLLFGPKKLPEIARILGKGMGELRRASNELRSSLEDEIRNLDREVQAERQAQTGNVSTSARERPEEALDLKREAQRILREGMESLGRAGEDEPRELTETVTDHGHDHREAAPREPQPRS
jgi:sec-independent protein translocase protein TatB